MNAVAVNAAIDTLGENYTKFFYELIGKIPGYDSTKIPEKVFKEKLFSYFHVSKEEGIWFFRSSIFEQAFKHLCDPETFWHVSQCIDTEYSQEYDDNMLLSNLTKLGANDHNIHKIFIEKLQENQKRIFLQQLCQENISSAIKFILINDENGIPFYLSFYYGHVKLDDKVYVHKFNEMILTFNKEKRKCSFIMGMGVDEIGTKIYVERHLSNVVAITKNGSYTLLDPNYIKLTQALYSIQ